MKKDQLIYLATHPITLALIFTIVSIQFLPPIFNKYSVTQISKERTSRELEIYYYDLDKDGYSEKIEVNKMESNSIVGVIVYTKKGVINQWNFNGVVLNDLSIFFGDINNDGLVEIFVQTLLNNTIYLVPGRKLIFPYE